MMLNGRRKATLKRVHAITELASERKDAAIRSSVSHVQETIALPPSAQRDHVLRQGAAFQADLLRLQHRATQALQHLIEGEVTKIRHGIDTVHVVIEALTAKEKLSESELAEAQKGALAISQALQKLANHASILAQGADELEWLEEQIQQREEITTCPSKRPAAKSSVGSL